jgi:ABC-type sugar transport system ATPase subunit
LASNTVSPPAGAGGSASGGGAALASSGAGEVVLAVDGIVKEFPGVRALAGVSLELRAGEVHALVGENGAGKSTLIKVLSGDVRPEQGHIRAFGKELVLNSPRDARRLGIVTIFQELMVVPELSVVENIVLGSEPSVGPGKAVFSRRKALELTRRMLADLGEGMHIDPWAPAGRLSTAHKQVIEIARALLLRAPVIIMDEPTAALSAREAERLLRIIRQLREEGRAILFVSHRLAEVRSIADRVTVLRGGQQVATLKASRVKSTGELIELMVGRPLSELYPPRNEKIGEVVFAVRGLTRKGAFADVSFEVRAGEVLGVGGLVGAGRTEVMRAIFGADSRDGGTILKDGRTLAIHNPRDAIRAGIAYLPEDRKVQGLVLLLSGRENLVLAHLDRISRMGFVKGGAVRRIGEVIAGRLRFRGDLDAPARTVSGGNQQKLVIGKWVVSQSRVLIFDEPTRGIDIGAKVEVYRLMHELAAQGAAIILVSSELHELMNVSHRMIVMSGGRVQDDLRADEFEERRILRAAFAAHISEAEAVGAVQR